MEAKLIPGLTAGHLKTALVILLPLLGIGSVGIGSVEARGIKAMPEEGPKTPGAVRNWIEDAEEPLTPADAATLEAFLASAGIEAGPPLELDTQAFLGRGKKTPLPESPTGIRQLMEKLENRPLAVMVMVDGLNGPYLRRVLLDDTFRARHGSPLETLRRVFFDEGREVEVSTGMTPTLSANNIATLLSGLAQGDSGEGNGFNPIPAFAYVDRPKKRWIWTLIPDARRVDALFAEGGRTLFEELEDRTTFAFSAGYPAGADVKYTVLLGEALRKVAPGFQESRALKNLEERARQEIENSRLRHQVLDMLDRRDAYPDTELMDRRLDHKIRRVARRALERHGAGLPDFVYWFNTWIDHDLHSSGEEATVVLKDRFGELEDHLSRLFGVYANPALPPAARDNLLLALVSDHGMHMTQNMFDFEAFLDSKEIEYRKTFTTWGLFKPLKKVVKFGLPGKEVILSSTAGGYIGIDLFHRNAYSGHGSSYRTSTIADPDRWASHPTHSDLRSLPLFDGRSVDWIEMLRHGLVARNTEGERVNVVDFILFRDDAHQDPAGQDPARHVAIRVVDQGGEALLRRRPDGAGNLEYAYEVLAGEDPLELMDASGGGLVGVDEGTFHSDALWQEATARTRRPDAIHRLTHLFDLPGAATIFVFPADDWRFFVDYVGRHGGESADEILTIQSFGGPAVSPGSAIPLGRIGSTPVTILHHLLGDGFAPERYDFPSFLPLLGSSEDANPR